MNAYLRCLSVMVVFTSLSVSTFADGPNDTESCKSTCAYIKEKCVQQSGLFTTFDEGPDGNQRGNYFHPGGLSANMQKEAIAKSERSNQVSELKQKCSDEFMQCKIPCAKAPIQ